MERKFKLAIPEPCSQDWNQMTPTENGRFCASCVKTVVDFSTMLPAEVQQFFIQNQNQNICGRFKASQLDTISIQIPIRVLHTQTQYHKMFLLALFIAMSTTLFSCADKDGKKQKIDNVEVVADSTKKEPITVGLTLPAKNVSKDSVLPPPPPPKVDQVKFVKGKAKINNEKHFKPTKISCGETVVHKKNKEEEPIYNGGISFEIQPEFDGGIEKFYDFFINEFHIPGDAAQLTTKMRITFIVERDGSLIYRRPSEEIGYKVDEEIARVLKLSPKWHPGESNGRKIRIQYVLPISLQGGVLKISNQ
ncbi:hypothetical protein [Flavobacterium geliluteum]|uniref:TonB C-terminal domain-containing protein n=1 Tax=Flavobacterium geliluteum TaxID=2816120 RepID=A0A940XHT6_9FLAO|nr:hypothetical protein [Flavobacterium geliluteum]MBP4139463.1 hypothetical protein [Flavobacterium geliluteum]